MNRRSRAFANVLSLQVSRVLSKAFSVSFLAVAARYLGTGGFGQWALIFLLIGFFSLVADYGLHGLTVRDVARDLSLSRKYLMNTLLFKSMMLIPVTGLFFGLISIADYPRETVDLMLIALPILYLMVLSAPFSSIIQAHERIYWVSALDIVQGLASSGIGIVVLLLGYGIQGLLVMGIVFAFTRLVGLLWIARRLIGGLRSPISPQFMKALVKKAFPFAVLGILHVIQLKADYFLISKLLGAAQLGLYAAAFKIFDNIILAGFSVNAALFPSISALFTQSKDRLRAVYGRMQKYFVMVAIPASVFIFVFAREIILLMYGSQYLYSVNVLYIFSLSFVIFFSTIPMRLVINNSDLLVKIIPYSTVMAAVNISLNLVVIPRYGIIGAAMVSLVAATADVFIRIHFIRRIFPEGARPIPRIWKPVFSAAIWIGIILLFSGLNRYVAAVLGFAAYLYSLHLMGEIGMQEYRLFVREPMGRILAAIGNRQAS